MMREKLRLILRQKIDVLVPIPPYAKPFMQMRWSDAECDDILDTLIQTINEELDMPIILYPAEQSP